ncbi:MAG: LTA synthase family protein [bacterium]|nr:LTA synthase family protein [bacterium]
MKAVKEFFDKLRNYLKNPKETFIKIKEFIIKNKQYIYMALPFIFMDLATRFLGRNINFFGIYRLVPNLFTITYVILFLGITLSFKKKIGKILYLFFNFLGIVFYLVNNIYYSLTNNFFSFNLLESSKEGAPYIMDAIVNCNILVYIFLIIIIFLIFWGYKNIVNVDHFDKKRLLKICLIFIILHLITPLFLGRANDSLVWSTWKNPRNVYNQYNDSNKSMRVSGLFEYTFRNFYVTFLRKEETDEEELAFLEEVYSYESEDTKNSYTGKFKGKNFIFLQLEGVDSWLLNEKDTPTLYKMMKNSINFTNHYSFYNGGGSTFNSEFAVNTGFIVPFSYNKNAYAFSNNNFPYSMANMFKSEGYIVNAFHMNNSEYYSRGINYESWGYDNYYGLTDMYKYDDNSYQLDRELILNEDYSNLMFNEETPFVDYIITYSPHTPFTNTKGVCKLLYELDNEGKEDIEFVEMGEEECIRRQVKETDYMVELLLNKLKEKKLLDDTVIVVFTDHYLYTLTDQSILEKYKKTENNLINKTPFFIYDNGKTKKEIKKVTSQLNILPTVLNLYGFSYNSNYYIGTDALNSSYSGIVFFSDYSWYDGNVYVEGGEVVNGKKISEKNLENNNLLVNNLAKKNDLTLKYNYFKKLVVKEIANEE